MRKTKLSVTSKVRSILGSQKFWYFVLGLFVFQALWLVFSAQYPMAFDENYHFGLIQLHAHQWLPFFTSQPPHAGAYGAAVRDPSYLYHWLMSFPYRLISAFTHQQTAQIIFLRLINVALFTYALVLYRKILRRIGLSAAFASCALLVFTLIPVVPFLAAHINYDNLLLVVLPLVVLITLDVFDSLSAKRIPIARLLVLAALLMLGSLVKYPFLPVLLVVAVYTVWRIGREKLFRRDAWREAWRGFSGLAYWRRIVVSLLVLLAIGLFAERYAVNVVQYHTPVPACDAVISLDECSNYGPWDRDYGLKNTKSANFHQNIVSYTAQWFYGMWYRLFFAINYTYASSPPLFVISRLAIVLAVVLVASVLLRARWLFRKQPARIFLLILIICYGLVLFGDNFQEYTETAEPVAINGRYWIPFLPFIFGLGGLAWMDILRHRPSLKVWVAVAVIAVFLLQGGGTMTYIVRSNNSWFWDNSLVRHVNADVRSAVSPVILGKSLD